jgi:hypothetical protein
MTKLGWFVIGMTLAFTPGCGGSSSSDGSGGTGTGGSGTGGSGAGGSSSLSGQVAEACAKQDSLSCADDDCVAEGNEAIAEAEPRGCVTELTNVVVCIQKYGWECVAGQGSAQVSQNCDPQLEVYGDCLGGCEGGGSSNGGCSMECTGKSPYGASCSPDGNGGLSCSCTSGPQTGKTFTTTGECFTAVDELAASECT